MSWQLAVGSSAVQIDSRVNNDPKIKPSARDSSRQAEIPRILQLLQLLTPEF